MHIIHKGLDLELFQQEFEEMRRMMGDTVRQNLKIADARIPPGTRLTKTMREFREAFGDIPY
jgi:hypothetical protein